MMVIRKEDIDPSGDAIRCHVAGIYGEVYGSPSEEDERPRNRMHSAAPERVDDTIRTMVLRSFSEIGSIPNRRNPCS